MIFKILHNGRFVTVGGTNNGQIFTVENLLSDTSLFTDIKSVAPSLAVAKLPDTAVLNVLSEDGTDISQIYAQVEKVMLAQNLTELSDALRQKLLAILQKAVNIDATILASMVLLCEYYYSYSKQAGMEGVPRISLDNISVEFFDETKSFLDSMVKSAVWPFASLSRSDNVTKYQHSPEDELFIKIPMPDALETVSRVERLLPKRREVFTPYGRTIADMTTYKDPESAVPKALYPEIEGVLENNTLPIQENEQKWYNALIEWVQFNMKQAGGDVDVSPSNPNLDVISQSFLVALCTTLYGWNWDHNPNIPKLEYEVAFDEESGESEDVSEWVHTPTKKELAAIESGLTDVSDIAGSHVNALIILSEFLREASLSLGYKVYIEAAVKLARWGKRKPRILYFEDYALAFDLNNNKVIQYIGDISNYDLQKVDDCDALAICAIYNGALFQDKSYMRGLNYEYDLLKAPVGVLCKKLYNNKTQVGPASLEFDMYVSLIDVVKSYLSGSDEFKLAGIEYKDGAFYANEVACDTEVTSEKLWSSYESSRTNLMSEPYTASESLRKLYLELNAGASKGQPLHHLCLLQSKQRITDLRKEFTIHEFSSKEDLEEKVSSRKIRLRRYAIDTGVVKVILPLYVEVSKRLPETYNMSDVLNLYKEVLSDMDYVSEGDFMNVKSEVKVDSTPQDNSAPKETTTPTTTASETTSAAIVTQTAAAQTTDTATNVSGGEPVSKNESSPENGTRAVNSQFSFVKSLNTSAVIIKLVNKLGETVGACAQESHTVTIEGRAMQVNNYVFIHPDELVKLGVTPTKQTGLRSLVGIILDNLYKLETGNTELVTGFFTSVETMKYYRDKITALLKEGNL